MSIYLYRAIATDDIMQDDLLHWREGDSLGRQSGYLSRSSAVDAGELRAPGNYKIVRSQPVVFGDSA